MRAARHRSMVGTNARSFQPSNDRAMVAPAGLRVSWGSR
jgi:hypothetical protein